MRTQPNMAFLFSLAMTGLVPFAAHAAEQPWQDGPLEVLQGAQMIDLGIPLKNTYQVEMDFIATTFNSSTVIFGARDIATSKKKKEVENEKTDVGSCGASLV